MHYVLHDHRYRRFTFHPATRAIEACASKTGPTRKAPTLGEEHVKVILSYVHEGAASELKLRAGIWCQISTGGRVADVGRLTKNAVNWGDRTIESIHWRWTKSIRRCDRNKVQCMSNRGRSDRHGGVPTFYARTMAGMVQSGPGGAGLERLHSGHGKPCLLYTSPSPRDGLLSRMPSSA